MDKKPLILIADDDAQALGVLEQIMTAHGYEVVTASEGVSAQQKVLERTPDLVILDNYMPGISGSEITRQIKNNPATQFVPVIMLTGFTETPDKVEAIESGADDFVNKPYKSVELTTRIKSLLKVKALHDELDSAESVIFALARAIEAKDNYTVGHTERVSQFALVVGYRLGLSTEEIDALRKGGILHDIGKIAIPDSILNKPGRLTPEEFDTIRTHPDRGEKICKPLNSVQSALKIVRHHHEKMDGSGYPDGLREDQIPVIARIMSIVDVYDALTTTRSYRAALSHDIAMSILEEEARKGWWDWEILEEFREVAGSHN
ncbi:MAG: response regulator [Endomicrobiales bacterium]|nr:response regulator [Endomicrobiales bacterium]